MNIRKYISTRRNKLNRYKVIKRLLIDASVIFNNSSFVTMKIPYYASRLDRVFLLDYLLYLKMRAHLLEKMRVIFASFECTSIFLWQPMFLWHLRQLWTDPPFYPQIARLSWTWAPFPIHQRSPRLFYPFQLPTTPIFIISIFLQAP